MSLLDEQLVEEWLNRNDFFTMRGLKCGVDEIDLLAIRENTTPRDCWHVEVQVSFRPIGYIGGDTSAKRRSPELIREGVQEWVQKKFANPKKIARRNSVVPNATWKHKFVHGNLRESVELDLMRELGVEPIPYTDVLDNLMIKEGSPSSSIASNIVEIIRFAHQRSPSPKS